MIQRFCKVVVYASRCSLNDSCSQRTKPFRIPPLSVSADLSSHVVAILWHASLSYVYGLSGAFWFEQAPPIGLYEIVDLHGLRATLYHGFHVTWRSAAWPIRYQCHSPDQCWPRPILQIDLQRR